jgi:hypothetical protein
MLTRARQLVTRTEDLVLKLKLPPVTSVDAELRKLGLIRMLTASVGLLRTIGIFIGFQFYPHEWAVGGLAWLPAEPVILFELAALSAVLVGFMTPLSILAVFLTYPQMDSLVATATLGTSIFETMLFVLLLCGSGQTRSVDAWLLRTPTRTPVHRAVAWLYGLTDTPDARRIEVAYTWGFLTFALVSFAAIFHHLVDSHWQRGHTSRILLATSYLSDAWQIARWTEETVPVLAEFVSYAGILGQTVFQVFMIPLAASRRGVWFIKYWGWVFILGSTLGIKLSYLPFIEVLLWWAIFHSARGEAALQAPRSPRRNGVSDLLSGCYAFGLLLFFPAYIPPTQAVADAIGLPTNRARQVLSLTNLHSPNVFNGTDLKMGDTWPVIERVGPNGLELVPFIGREGQRGWYHFSDIIYFGNSVQWRRFQIGKTGREYNRPGAEGRKRLEAIINGDYRLQVATGKQRYRVSIWRTQGADYELSVSERFNKTLEYRFEVDVLDGKVVFRSD